MIIVFDAECLLCNRWVTFLLRHDHKSYLKFASIQSDKGIELLNDVGLQVQGLETLLVIDGRKSYQHTIAIFIVLHQLGWPWRFAWLAWIIPSALRDHLYRWLARNRYSWFGRQSECILLNNVDKDRFYL